MKELSILLTFLLLSMIAIGCGGSLSSNHESLDRDNPLLEEYET